MNINLKTFAFCDNISCEEGIHEFDDYELCSMCLKNNTCYICERKRFNNREEIHEHLAIYHEHLLTATPPIYIMRDIKTNFNNSYQFSYLYNVLQTMFEDNLESKLLRFIEHKTVNDEYENTLKKSHSFKGFDKLLSSNKIKIISSTKEDHTKQCNLCDEHVDEYIVCTKCLPTNESDYSLLCKDCFIKSYTSSCSDTPNCIYCRSPLD